MPRQKVSVRFDTAWSRCAAAFVRLSASHADELVNRRLSRELTGTQRFDRIAARRQPAPEQCHAQQHQRGGRDNPRMARADAVQKRLDESAARALEAEQAQERNQEQKPKRRSRRRPSSTSVQIYAFYMSGDTVGVGPVGSRGSATRASIIRRTARHSPGRGEGRGDTAAGHGIARSPAALCAPPQMRAPELADEVQTRRAPESDCRREHAASRRLIDTDLG